MRFMMLMYPGGKPEEGAMPSAEAMTAMMKYNEELAKAGVLISLDGLQPTSRGARVAFSGGRASVTDGPFTESKEMLGGYWMIRVDLKEDAVAWAERCPAQDDNFIEVRQVFEMSDFPADVRDEAAEKRVCEALTA